MRFWKPPLYRLELLPFDTCLAYNQTRTGDLFLTKEVLYRLSYVGLYPYALSLSAVDLGRLLYSLFRVGHPSRIVEPAVDPTIHKRATRFELATFSLEG